MEKKLKTFWVGSPVVSVVLVALRSGLARVIVGGRWSELDTTAMKLPDRPVRAPAAEVAEPPVKEINGFAVVLVNVLPSKKPNRISVLDSVVLVPAKSGPWSVRLAAVVDEAARLRTRPLSAALVIGSRPPNVAVVPLSVISGFGELLLRLD